ncbi:keratin, type II cytoskeletal 2 epidermal-like [Ricinus communis]|uniref:keratin, type II cytoskeletal 2 epidermal-like n=1 Tax=Ricinus communis TaxID=3988 RepID=UPI00201A94D6|nr:keratin, type II cytoskeletal 2 epidermal-like [Ricinus communis]
MVASSPLLTLAERKEGEEGDATTVGGEEKAGGGGSGTQTGGGGEAAGRRREKGRKRGGKEDEGGRKRGGRGGKGKGEKKIWGSIPRGMPEIKETDQQVSGVQDTKMEKQRKQINKFLMNSSIYKGLQALDALLSRIKRAPLVLVVL